MSRYYDVIVVGLGHAGCEAALACARMGLRTLGITLKRERIAVMSCNPAIGGTAKGHLVHELDALGGEMARVADRTGTHFKILNESRGPAVRASRVLCDRDAYSSEMSAVIATEPRLEVVEGEVRGLLVAEEAVRGVALESGGEREAAAVILTTGTFLRGLIHTGQERQSGGRIGDPSSNGLSDCLRSLGFELGRFKTGTPARLRRASLDYSRCTPQPGDSNPRPLSLRTRERVESGEQFPYCLQLTCHITHTTAETHRLVRENLHRSPLYQGAIVGRGPRYCPSLEDKVTRFADRARHQVFLEPEGPQSEIVYPAGLSTSLPAEVQLTILRSIPGLEDVEVERFGYAVEYDYAPPTQLRATLETRRIAGLYFAGQLNGTSGYEEAAFQGLLAGINAALAVKGERSLLLGRKEAHGSVLIDELVTRGVDEPFRMFTARSEHRLRLREGNADLRLRAHGHRIGLVSDEEFRRTEDRRARIGAELQRLKAKGLADRLRRPGQTYADLAASDPTRPALPAADAQEVEVELKYAGYIAQQDRATARAEDTWDAWRIPRETNYATIRGLSAELAERLEKLRPETVREARRMPGLTSAGFFLLLVHLRRRGGLPRTGGRG